MYTVCVYFQHGVQKIIAITKVYKKRNRNIFLKLAQFEIFYLKFLIISIIKSKELLFIFGHPQTVLKVFGKLTPTNIIHIII